MHMSSDLLVAPPPIAGFWSGRANLTGVILRPVERQWPWYDPGLVVLCVMMAVHGAYVAVTILKYHQFRPMVVLGALTFSVGAVFCKHFVAMAAESNVVPMNMNPGWTTASVFFTFIPTALAMLLMAYNIPVQEEQENTLIGNWTAFKNAPHLPLIAGALLMAVGNAAMHWSATIGMYSDCVIANLCEHVYFTKWIAICCVYLLFACTLALYCCFVLPLTRKYSFPTAFVLSCATAGFHFMAAVLSQAVIISPDLAYHMPHNQMRENAPYIVFLSGTIAHLAQSIADYYIKTALMDGQAKQIETAKNSAKVAYEVAELLVYYNTDQADELIEKATRPTTNPITGDIEPPLLDMELIGALRVQISSLKSYRPYIPEFLFVKDDMDEDLEFYDSALSEEDEENETNNNATNSDIVDKAKGEKGKGKKKTNKEGGSNDRVSIRTSDKSNDRHQASPSDAGSKYASGRRRSWEASSGSDEDEFGNRHGANSIQRSQPGSSSINSDGSKGSSGTGGGHNTKIQNTQLKGLFRERIIAGNIRLSSVSELLFLLLIGTSNVGAEHSRNHIRQPSFVREASSRLNKIIEIVLDNASIHETTVHSLFGDQIILSVNATVRATHAAVKACRCILAMETQIRKEIQNWLAMTSVARLQKISRRLAKTVIGVYGARLTLGQMCSSLNNNNTLRKNQSDAAGIAIADASGGINTLDDGSPELLRFSAKQNPPSLSLHSNNNNNNNPVVESPLMRRTSTTDEKGFAGANNNPNNNNIIPNGRSGPNPPVPPVNPKTSGTAAANPQPSSPKTITEDSKQLSASIYEQIFTDRSALTGALVSCDAWVQLGGSLKRQQFIATSLSESDMLQHAFSVGISGNFVSVCRLVHQDAEYEFTFRGCSVYWNNNGNNNNNNDSYGRHHHRSNNNGDKNKLEQINSIDKRMTTDGKKLSLSPRHSRLGGGGIVTTPGGGIVTTPGGGGGTGGDSSVKKLNISAGAAAANPNYQDSTGIPYGEEAEFSPADQENKNNKNNNNNNNNIKNDLKGPESSAAIGKPIYELVGKKKQVGTDDEWLYLIAGKAGEKQTAGHDQANAGAGTIAPEAPPRDCQGILLNEAVLELSKGNLATVKEVLDRMQKDEPTSEILPATISLKAALASI